MKIVKGFVVAALVVSMAGGALASSIAAKVWNAESDEIDDSAMHYGISSSVSLGGGLWISGMYLIGTYDDVWGSGVDFDTADGEVVVGYTADIFDFGVGARYSKWTFGDKTSSSEVQIFGPMVYAGLGNTFGESPLGWYVGGSYMFLDLGDAYDNESAYTDTYEHYNVEGGLFLAVEALTATVGYRVKDYVNFDNSEFSGIAGTVGFGF